MLILCPIDPGPRSYRIEKIKDVWFCYPKKKADIIELFSEYSGNHFENNLDLRETDITELPIDLTVLGMLFVSKTKLTELPYGLKCGGLIISHTEITELPEDIFIYYHLVAWGSRLEKLPPHLSLEGDLNICFTKVSHIPETIIVKDTLYLDRYCRHFNENWVKPVGVNKIDWTPKKWTQYTKFDVETVITVDKPHHNTKRYTVKRLNNVWLCFPPTEEERMELLWMFSGNNLTGDIKLDHCMVDLPETLNVNGNLSIRSEHIQKVSENLTVSGSLDIGYGIKTLPNNLFVGKTLDLSYSQIKSIPDSATILGDLYVHNSNIPENFVKGDNIKGEVIGLWCVRGKEVLVYTLRKPKEEYKSRFIKLANGYGIFEVFLPNTSHMWGKENRKYKYNEIIDLDLRNIYIDALPANLRVFGSANLGHCNLTELPYGMFVSQDLVLSYSNITEIPKSLRVNGKLVLTNSKIKEMAPNPNIKNVVW